MAKLLPNVMDEAEGSTGFIGASIIGVVTAGMYDDPLMIYREYLQNSVDAVDVAEERGRLEVGEGRIEIRIDPEARRIEIEDNGIGIANDWAELKLGSVGYSDKNASVCRGFRGIGRLGGLGYCDEVRFETRSHGDEEVAVVAWDGRNLRRFMAENGQASASAAVEAACSISYEHAYPSTPSHFCKVVLSGIHSFRDDRLIRRSIVRDYLSQIGPVPFAYSKFSHAEEIEKRVAELIAYRIYSISVDGESVHKPYSDRIVFSDGFSDIVRGVEFFEFKSPKGDTTAIGWYGITNLLGAIPKATRTSGIRIRSGNIQIGDEYALAEHFSEHRFARWHLGELHIAGGYVQPNARRDDFEQSREYETFLEQASLLGRVLSKQCQEVSDARGSVRAAKTALTKLENLIMHARSLLGPSHLEKLTRRADGLLAKLGGLEREAILSPDLLKRLDAIRERRQQFESIPFIESCLDSEVLAGTTPKEVIEAMCLVLMEEYSGACSAENLMDKMTAQYRNGMPVEPRESK